jgi:hypothetical protein
MYTWNSSSLAQTHKDSIGSSIAGAFDRGAAPGAQNLLDVRALPPTAEPVLAKVVGVVGVQAGNVRAPPFLGVVLGEVRKWLVDALQDLVVGIHVVVLLTPELMVEKSELTALSHEVDGHGRHSVLLS